ncbi:MAG: hypothetical protein ABIQ40_14800 [Bacteroidia bacterium]
MRIGEKIKERAEELRIRPTELGRMIKTSKQNIYNIFERDSIDTLLLQKLSKALEFDFFSCYSNSPYVANSPAADYARNNKNPTEKEIALQNELKELGEKYELLKALYEAKTKEKVPGAF